MNSINPLNATTASMQLGDPSDEPDAVYRIGDLAREFNVTLRTLRFYEDKGLMTPQRSGSTRLYRQSDRARLSLILFGKRVGFSLVEIRTVLESYDSNQHLRNPMSRTRPIFEERLVALRSEKIDTENVIDELMQQLNSEDGIFSS